MDTQLDLSFRHILTVSELTSLIKSIVEDSFPNVWVEGEIYNFRAPISGHAYFTLKDSSSQIKAVLFKSSARTIRFVPKDGLHVLCRGRITIYDFRGEYQLVVDYMEPKGVGALLLAFEQLKERLAKEGLFDKSRKRPVPVLPKKIGIVTSPTGAAIRDILKVIDRRFANVEIVIAPAVVQGERAAPEIVEAISDLNRIEDIDVIIVTRGGGGIEDLWPFNEEIVARAIYNSKIPVISAVGHEIDYTIADFVADLRAPTPSAAAEMVVKNKEDIQHRIETLYQRLVFAKRTFFEKKRDRLFSMSRRVLSPDREINRYIQRVDELATRLQLSASHIIALKKEALYGVMAKLGSLSPLAILSRGYSITYKLPARSVVNASSDVQKGDRVDIRLHEGNIICIVEGILKDPF
ncbi:MAG: exodeoxyribonuclease VII large subunit [Nitrospirae bacterium]|nr:exodeoxyribonuclease VII large subunit [Nitrospirota bacterium]